MVNFTDEEAKASWTKRIASARKWRRTRSAVTGSPLRCAPAWITIEHGDGLTDVLLDEMAKRGIYWVPTITVGMYVAPGRGGNWPKMAELQRENFPKAIKKGVKNRAGHGCRRL